ncbi:MAG: Fur family transcriptional regulator [Candidatus Thorarchaeota archaeon]
MKVTKDQLITLLRDKGYKVTPQRLAICLYVLASDKHPTVEEIRTEISKTHPTISMNTIYLTMDMLIELNLVQELRYENSSRYDPNTSVHVNVICQQCGRIWDYESKDIEIKWNEIVELVGTTAVGQRLDLYTTCKDCR